MPIELKLSEPVLPSGDAGEVILIETAAASDLIYRQLRMLYAAHAPVHIKHNSRRMTVGSIPVDASQRAEFVDMASKQTDEGWVIKFRVITVK